jgi:hypothetical protein
VLPTSYEVIQGVADPMYRVHYTELVSQIGRAEQHAGLEARTTAEFQWIDASSAKATRGLDKTDAFLTRSSGIFSPRSTSIEVAFSAGTALVVFATNETIYQGGYLNVPADGQQIDFHVLDVATIDPETGRFATLTRYGNNYEALSGLQLMAGASAKPDAPEAIAPTEPEPVAPLEPEQAAPVEPAPAEPTQPVPATPSEPEGY